MADKEINDLTDGGYAADDDLVHVVRSGNSRKAKLRRQLPATPASSSGPASMEFAEDTDSGSHKVTVTAPASLAADVILTLPSKTGTVALESDTDRRNQMLIAAGQAKALAGYQRFLDVYADGFKASDGVKVASSSNYTVDTSAGCVKPDTGTPTAISQGTGTTIGNMTGFGGLAAAFDGNTSQNAASGARIDSVTNGYVGKNYSAAPKKFGQAVVTGSSDNGFETGGGTVTINIYGKNGGAPSSATDGTLLGTTGSFSDSSSLVKTITSTDFNTSWDYLWAQVVSTVSGAILCAELVFYTPGTINNSTVVTTLQTADAARTKGRVIVEIDDVTTGSTIGTDYTIEFSCNNEANWTAASTYTNAGKGQAGRSVYETDEVTCTSGTVLAARIKTLNNKDIRTYKLAWKAAA